MMIIRLIVTALIFEEILKLKYVQANDEPVLRYHDQVGETDPATTFVFGFLCGSYTITQQGPSAANTMPPRSTGHPFSSWCTQS